MNPKFEMSRIGELQSIRQFSITKSEFGKLFDKNISGQFGFPSNIGCVQEFSKRFEQKKFYYNHFHDQEYEKFIMKNNKRKLLKSF
jgi:hypothetical protein